MGLTGTTRGKNAVRPSGDLSISVLYQIADSSIVLWFLNMIDDENLQFFKQTKYTRLTKRVNTKRVCHPMPDSVTRSQDGVMQASQ